jgi:hypothetical protein
LRRLAGFGTVRVTQVWVKGQTLSLSSFRPDGAPERGELPRTLDGVRLVVAIYNLQVEQHAPDRTERAQFTQYAQAVVRTVPASPDFVIGNEPNNNLFWQPQFKRGRLGRRRAGVRTAARPGIRRGQSVRPAARIFGAGLAARGGDSASSSKPTHSPVTFMPRHGERVPRASGRDGADHWTSSTSTSTRTPSSVPPSFDHPGNNTISVSDYPKLVTTLGTAFDGTGQPGSTLPIVYGEFGVESLIPSDKASRYNGTEPTPTEAGRRGDAGRYYIQALKIAYLPGDRDRIMLFPTSATSPTSTGGSPGLDYVDDSAKTSLPLVRDAIGATNAGTLTELPDSNAAPPSTSTRRPTARP